MDIKILKIIRFILFFLIFYLIWNFYIIGALVLLIISLVLNSYINYSYNLKSIEFLDSKYKIQGEKFLKEYKDYLDDKSITEDKRFIDSYLSIYMDTLVNVDQETKDILTLYYKLLIKRANNEYLEESKEKFIKYYRKLVEEKGIDRARAESGKIVGKHRKENNDSELFNKLLSSMYIYDLMDEVEAEFK